MCCFGHIEFEEIVYWSNEIRRTKDVQLKGDGGASMMEGKVTEWRGDEKAKRGGAPQQRDPPPQPCRRATPKDFSPKGFEAWD
jgi:hypothetical protein